VLFNADCKKQVFFPKPSKNIAQIRLVDFEKSAIISKNDVTESKARLLS